MFFVVAMSSRTELCDDVVDATPLSALDVVQIKSLSSSSSFSALDVVEINKCIVVAIIYATVRCIRFTLFVA